MKKRSVASGYELDRIVASVCAAAAMLIPTARQALAQEADAPVQEITVTATKRTESILAVPLSISAIGADQLEQKGVRDLEALSQSVPGLTVVTDDENAAGKIFVMRGIAAAPGTAATVAVYLDDTPLTVGQSSPDLKLFDAERVEVLRGPQGTLFGSSAMGGAIRYVTPDSNFDRLTARAASELASIDGNGLNYEGQAAVSGPLSEALAFRASGFYRRDGGYVDLVDEDTLDVVHEDVNATNTYGGRLALQSHLSEAVDITASVLFQDQHRLDFPQFFTGVGATEASSIPLERFQKSARSGNDAKDRFVMPNLLVEVELGSATLASSSSYVDRRIRINNDFSYFFEGLFVNAFGIPESPQSHALISNNRQDYDLTSLVQEIRLTSRSAGPFTWLAGGYYRQSKGKNYQLDSSPNIAAFIAPIFGAAEEDFALLYERDGVQKTTEIAAFGEASFSFAGKFKLTAGLRASRLREKNERIENGAFAGAAPVNEKSTESAFTPKLSLSYDIGDEAMLYVTAAKGFREGGPNGGVASFCEAELAALGLSEAPSSFRSDSLWSYEAGAKFAAFDRRITLQGDIYRIDWKNLQQTISLASCGNSFNDNVGKAVVKGAEVEATLHATRTLAMNLALGYVDATLAQDFISGTDPSGAPVVAALSGTRLQDTPDLTLTLAARYDFPLGANWGAYLRGEFSYIGDAHRHLNTPSDDPRTQLRRSYHVSSARLAASNGRYEVALFGDNLFDARPKILDVFYQYNPWGSEGRTSIRPRTVGISASAKF